MPENTNAPEDNKVQLSIDPQIEYKYRDLFNLHISPEDVVLELGNIQRSTKTQGVIKDIIVMSPANAMRLQQALAQSIKNMQQKIQEIQEKNQ